MMGTGLKIIKSLSREPAVNFALERGLLERDGDFLLLYINSECVVAGRNQSLEAEADLEWCAREGVPVVRRISGGGAVWHDEGNVNWAFITSVPERPEVSGGPGTGGTDGADRADGALPLDDTPLARVTAALRKMGIEAVAGSRGELLVAGPAGKPEEEVREEAVYKKISGTASCVRRGRRLFHGTLLFDTDLSRMGRALAGDPAKRARKVASVPSPIMNLKPLLKGFDTAAEFMDALADLLAR